jgi:hypothetical protein
MTVADRGPFAQLPYTLWSYKELSTSEKWLATTIVRLCWRPGPHLLSMHTLAAESGISAGAMCPCQGKQKREGMIAHLERLGLIKTYRPVDEEGNVKKGTTFLIELTGLLWEQNKGEGVYSVNTPVQNKGEGVYSVNSTVYKVNTSVYSVDTSIYSVNTQEGISLDEKRDEQAPIDSIDKEDKRDSSPSPSEQHTDAFLVPTLPLRDDVSIHTSSYSHEPAESEWLWESEGETDIFSEDIDPTEKRQVVQQGGNLAPGEGRAPLESKDRREGSNEHPAVKPPSPGQPPASPGRAAQLREQPTEQYNPHEKPRQPTGPPTDLSSEASKPPLPDKTEGKGNRKKDAALLCETKKVRELIDATRGHALEDPGALINQSKIIHAWCEKHPIEHATLVLHHIMTSTCKKHAWWRAHLDAFSAKALAQLTSEILPELGLVPKPELPPDIPMPAAAPSSNGKYHPYTRASMYEPIEIGV